MKLKFINLLLASVLLVGSAQVFTSCKDNEADLYVNLIQENISLKDRFQKDWEQIPGLREDLDKAQTDIANAQGDIEALKGAINGVGGAEGLASIASQVAGLGVAQAAIEEALKNLAAADSSNLASLESKIDAVKQLVDNIPPDLSVEVSGLTDQVSGLNDIVNGLNGQLGGINDQIDALKSQLEGFQPIVPDLTEYATKVYADAVANQAAVDAVNTFKENELQQIVNGINDDLGQIRIEATNYYNEAVSYAEQVVDQLDAKLTDDISAVDTNVKNLGTEVANNSADITALQNNLTTLGTKVDAIKQTLDLTVLRVTALENRVTGVVLEGTTNSIIGYFSTPIGINSNILMQYCGSNSVAFAFPCADGEKEYMDKENGQGPVLTSADLALIGAKETQVPKGRLMHTDDGNLGTIYFTLNPTNIDLEGKTVQLVNSKGDVSTVLLKNVRPCYQVKTFGYSRITPSANGYYMADATLPAGASIEALEIKAEPGLAAAAQELYGDLKAKKVDLGSLAKLGRAIYDQVNGILPALAIQTTWSEQGTAHAVSSQYGVAAAVFQPLSFSTLYGKHFRDIKLPDIMDKLRETVVFHFDTSGIKIDLSDIEFNVDLSGVSLNIPINLTCQIDDLGELTVDVVVKDVPDGGYVTTDPVTGENKVVFDKFKDINVTTDVSLTDLTNKLNAQLALQFDNMSDQLEADIQEAFDEALSQIEVKIGEAVNGMLESVQVKIDETLDDVVSDLQKQVNDHIEGFFDKVENSRLYDAVEKLISKINDLTDDPNHYMQPVLLYKANGNYGKASDVADFPTLFKLNAGNAVTLVATTYNAELVTPTYLKYIAVSNVYKYGNKAVSAANGDAKCLKLMKAANDQQYMNEAVSGERTAFAFNMAGGNGYVYEIAYQAVDYHGVVSTNKYYVRVK